MEELKLKIGDMIKTLRAEKGISQETLAAVCDVSMQAVSKWENGQSCPDIAFLPLLADYFQVSTDYLLTGRNDNPYFHASEHTVPEHEADIHLNEADKDVLYIVQYYNGQVIDKTLWKTEQTTFTDTIKIAFSEEFQHLKDGLHIQVWGNANIEGQTVEMGITAGANVSCSLVNGMICAGANVTCGNVEGNISAGKNINCADVKGKVRAGHTVTCNTIEGDAKAANGIHIKN